MNGSVDQSKFPLQWHSVEHSDIRQAFFEQEAKVNQQPQLKHTTRGHESDSQKLLPQKQTNPRPFK